MMRNGLTARQRQCFLFIREQVQATGVSPSYSEIAAALNLKNRGAVGRLVACLEERGWVTSLPGKSRSVFPVEAAP